MKAAMVRHDALLEKAITANRGYVFSRMRDGMAAFATAGDAVPAAATFQRALAAPFSHCVRERSPKDRPEVAGVLRVAGYAAYRAASPSHAPPSGTGHGDPEVNFVLVALRENGELVAAALGEDRQRRASHCGCSNDHGRSRFLRTRQHRPETPHRPGG